MMAYIASFGGEAIFKALTYGLTAILGFLGLALIGRTIQQSGIDKQKAKDADANHEADKKAIAARNGVDARSEPGLDDGLRKFERK